jgi:ATP-dependent DNA helicase DinG
MTAPALTVDDILGPGGLLSRVLPGYEARPEQLELARAAAAVLAAPAGGVLLAEAGTGVGKSLAYLAAAVVTGKRVLVSTALKSLQDQLSDKDLHDLARALAPLGGAPLTWVVVKGRQNYLCLRALDELQAEAAQERLAFDDPSGGAHADWPRLLAWAAATADGDLERLSPPLPEAEGARPFHRALLGRVTVTEDDCPGKDCPLYDRCYTTRAREAARTADVVVTNHALVLVDAQLRALTAGQAAVLPETDALIVDEAHALPEVARRVLGEELRFTYGRTLAYRLPRLPGGEPGDGLRALALHHALEAWAVDLRERLAAQRRLAPDAGPELVLADEQAWAAPVMDAAEAVAEACRERAGQWREVALELEREARTRRDRGDLDADAPDEEAQEALATARRWERQADATSRFAGVAEALATPPELAAPDADPDAFVRLAVADRDAADADASAGDPIRRLVARRIPVDVATGLRLYIWGLLPPRARTAAPEGGAAPEAAPPPRPVVATSATLAAPIANAFGRGRRADGDDDPFAFYAREAGVPGAPRYELLLDSPFDHRRQARLYVPPRVAFVADRRTEPERYLEELAREVYRLLLAAGGRAFVLFTSHRSLRAVAAHLGPHLPAGWRVFVQGAAPRRAVVDAFRDAGGPPCVLFATRSFFEGADVRGAGLSLVVLASLPFPVPSEPVYAARSRQVGRQVGDAAWGGWRHLGFPLMAQTTKQAVGRLIRSATDTGVVAILDRRVLEKSYGSTLLRSLPPMPLIHRTTDVRAFLAGAAPAGAAAPPERRTP